MVDARSYDELPRLGQLDMRHAWGAFGEDDRLGSINLLTSDMVLSAIKHISTGVVVPLNLPMNEPDPPLFGRAPYKLRSFAINRNEMDDVLGELSPQASTQWDALGHVRCREYGYWGGRITDPTDAPTELGIEQWAQHGIVGRGVLVDVASWANHADHPIDPLSPTAITVEDLRATLNSQQVTLEAGDIICVRTGWISAYRGLGKKGRDEIATSPSSAGLSADEGMARFIWNAHPSALCCDNPAVENQPGDPSVGSLHRRLIPLLGLALGELFDFDSLADRCSELEKWTFLFVSCPFNLPSGLGSPANAMAIL